MAIYKIGDRVWTTTPNDREQNDEGDDVVYDKAWQGVVTRITQPNGEGIPARYMVCPVKDAAPKGYDDAPGTHAHIYEHALFPTREQAVVDYVGLLASDIDSVLDHLEHLRKLLRQARKDLEQGGDANL